MPDQATHGRRRIGDVGRLVRMDADDRPDSGDPLREVDGLLAADREDAAHPGRRGGGGDVLRLPVAHLEVRVGVDHAPEGASRGKSGGGCSTAAPAAVRPSPARSQPAAPGSPTAARIRSEAAGMYG
jgi:hypothetical protein